MKRVSTQLILNKAMLNQQDPEGPEHLHQAYYYNIKVKCLQLNLYISSAVSDIPMFVILNNQNKLKANKIDIEVKHTL